jgi:hypothetical protein
MRPRILYNVFILIFICTSYKIRGCIQKFPDWPPGARTGNGIALSTRCSCIVTLCVSLVSFASITLCATSQLVFTVAAIYFVIDSVRALLDTPSYGLHCTSILFKTFLCVTYM